MCDIWEACVPFTSLTLPDVISIVVAEVKAYRSNATDEYLEGGCLTFVDFRHAVDDQESQYVSLQDLKKRNEWEQAPE